MKKILKPIYLIYFGTIPQIILGISLALAYKNLGEFPEKYIILCFGVHTLLNIFVLVYYFKNKSAEHISLTILKVLLVGFAAMFSVTIVLLLKQFNGYSFISPESVYLLLNSITLLYLVAAVILQKNENADMKKEIILCVLIPIIASVMFSAEAYNFQDIFMIVAVGLFCAFSYYMISLLNTLYRRKRIKEQEDDTNGYPIKYRVYVMIVAILLPVVGLMLNNGNILSWENGIFGDFSNIWFYVIAVANGLIMLIKTNDNRLMLPIFFLKIVGFSYIVYFTLVFIPIMPYGILGLVAYGLGILIFAPLMVFVTELLQIITDVKRLSIKFSSAFIASLIIMGFISIPAVMGANFYIDRVNFYNALTYLSSNNEVQHDINIKRLETPLKHINNELTTVRSNDVFNNGTNIPLISKYYQVIALDDKIPSLDTTQKLERIFFGKTSNKTSDENESQRFTLPQSNNVNIINSSARTIYDEESGIYKTWVDLEIRNDSDINMSEFIADFKLPDGCFIKDYYLYVGDEKKQGILADRRAALITYNKIIRTPKDPGILYYKGDDILELRVYPFSKSQIRKTGFLVMHSQNEVLKINNVKIPLTAEKFINEPIDLQGVSFIPASYKKNLPSYEREPQYCFVIDGGENSPYTEHIKKVREYIQKNDITNARFYIASYNAEDVADSDLETKNIKNEGGFNLSLAMEKIYSNTPHDTFPIIIAVTDNMLKATMFDKSSITRAFPESEYYYNLNYDLSLTPYTLNDNIKTDNREAPFISNVLSYNGIAVSDNDKSETVLNASEIGGYTDNEYYNSFLLQEKTLSNPKSNGEQLNLIRDSFRQKVLTKYTAFMVLETKEQEASLLSLQEKFLNGKQDDAPAVMMSEPGWIYFIILAIILLFYKHKKRRCMG